MKKNILLLLSSLFIISCGKNDTTIEKTKEASANLDTETVFSFDINNLQPECNNSSDLICSINTTVKCIINPNFSECAKNKDFMPPFIFMQDENLARPTFQSYKITKLVPRADGAVEAFTQSSCNGNWFGLCNGNIVYVMKNIDSLWHVIDIYAIEF